MLSLTDITALSEMEKKYNENKVCIAYIAIDNIEDVVIERLQAMYNVSKEEAQYIFSLYNLETTWDYSSKFTTNNITYTIKLVLK